MKPEFRTADADHGGLAYWRAGTSPSCVFVHGLVGHSRHFLGALDHAPRDIGILGVDLAGFGASSRLADDESYTFAGQMDRLLQLLNTMGADRVQLVLHSMAAALLVPLLEQRQLDIQRVVLLEGNLITEDAEWSHTLGTMSDARFDQYFTRLQAAGWAALAQQLRAAHDKKQIKEWAQCYGQADARAMRESARELSRLTHAGVIRDAVAAFADRVVYLRRAPLDAWGGREFLSRNAIPLHEVADTGHYLMLDNPKVVYDLIFDI